MSYVVIVQRTPLQRDVYGPYRSFRRAEGDAQAWGGAVEPVSKPAAHTFESTVRKAHASKRPHAGQQP